MNLAEDLSRAVVLVAADAEQEKGEHQRAEGCQYEPDEGEVADAFQHQGDQGHPNRGAKAVAKLDAAVIFAVTFFAKEGIGEPGQADRSHRNANAEEEDHQDQEGVSLTRIKGANWRPLSAQQIKLSFAAKTVIKASQNELSEHHAPRVASDQRNFVDRELDILHIGRQVCQHAGAG